jgi:hypothetical protein
VVVPHIESLGDLLSSVQLYEDGGSTLNATALELPDLTSGAALPGAGDASDSE